MSTEVLERRFAAIGARLNVVGPPVGAPAHRLRLGRAWRVLRCPLRRQRPPGRARGGGRQPRRPASAPARADGEEKSKFLCGHDERHWFVAAIPEDARGVTDVAAAKAALQPQAVHEPVRRTRPKDPFRRRNAAYVRQGEWFFVPAAGLDPPAASVLRDEPLTRGRGTAAHAAVRLPHRRRTRLRQPWASERDQRGSLRAADARAASVAAGGRLGCAIPRCTRRARFVIRTTRRFTSPAGTAC